ncbi:MAG TPA: GGDEF domain-containing protein [Xanthobacteraceae bacterium]
MSLDVNTLFFLTMYVEAILGLLLLLVWVQNPSTRAVAWWGSAHLMRSLSVALYGMYGSAPDLITIDFAGALLFTSFGVTWNGARLFDGRALRPGSLLLGATVWMLAAQFPGFAGDGDLRTLLSAGIIASFSWATAYEFWRGRAESLVSRWPAILLLFGHGSLFLLRTPLSALIGPRSAEGPLNSAWLTVLSAEALLFSIATAFVLLAMAKERTEFRHKTAAMLDPLTGLANRRCFMQEAEKIARRQVAAVRPVAVFLIDCDHFKSVNDRFGHAVGDKVLKLFAQVCGANLRSNDLVGRLGGEEFAVLLADAARDNAFVVAERIRSGFATAALLVDDRPVAATISVGVAIMADPDQDLAALLAQADQALYRAKARGRNRVQLAPMEGAIDESGAPLQAELRPSA